MSNNFQEVLQGALQLPLAEQIQLREALEDAEGAALELSPRIPGLNQYDPRVLQDLEAEVPAEYLGELP